MSRVARWKVEKTKVKVVFRLQFHATHIQQTGWDKLFISFIPADSGKAIGKTTKANVRNGTCKWADPIYETTRLLQDIKTKQYDEKLYKFVVAMGSSRSSILGEATINLADYADASKPSTVSLPLHGGDSGTILHVTVQLLTSKTGFREFEQQRELRERGLQSGNDQISPDQSCGGINNQLDKVNARVRFKDKSKELPSLEEEAGLNEDYTESAVGFDSSSNTSESLYAEKHDASSTHEIDSLKSIVSGDLAGHNQSLQQEKGDPSDQRFSAQGTNDWVPGWGLDYSADNDLAIAHEENNRLRGCLEMAESSIHELKLEVSSLQSHADEIGMEAQNFAQKLAAEIASGEQLAEEVSALKSECSHLKSDLERLIKLRSCHPFTSWEAVKQGTEITMSTPNLVTCDRSKVNEIGEISLNKYEQYLSGTGLETELYQPDLDMLQCVGIPALASHEHSSVNPADSVGGKIFELLRELDESKAERESLAKKMDQMECYYEALIQELEENQRHMLGELQNLRNEHSSCLYTVSSAKAEIEAMRLDVDEQVLRFSEERRVLESLNKELERRAVSAEAALKRARLNYSIAVNQLQKDLELLSSQVLSMYQTNENLIKQAFVDSPQPSCQEYQDMVQNRKLNPEESHANRHLECQDQYIGVKKQHLGGDILIEDLKRSLYLQEGLYRKVEEEACELLSVNIYLDVFSKTLQKTLLEASGEIRLMKEKMDELSHQLELSTESNELLMQRKESLENGNLRRETSLLQKELETVKTDFDELASVNKNLQRTINNLQNKMHDMLSSYGESFSELCLHNKSADQNLESKDLTSVIMRLEVLQRNACQKIRQLMQEKKALIDEKDRAQMSFSKSESDIVLVKQKFEHDLRNMIDKQSVSNALLQKLQLRFEAVADKLKVSSEVEENNAQRHTDLFSDLDYLEVELQQLSSKNRDLAQEILALQVVTEEFDRSKQTISELIEENRALMVALQDKSEESVKLALEVDSFKQSFQSLHDELLVERSLRDDLKSAVSDITSQLSAKHSQLLDFDQQKSELIQKTAVLTKENQDLMVSLQNKSEEAAKLAVELDSVRNSLQSVHDELHGERSLSDELKSRAIDISSQLNEKQQQLIDFDQQNSEMIQKIAELTSENQALMVSLQEYAEESSRLASEGNTSKETLQSLRDELQSERSLRDELKNVVTDLTSQLNEKHCQLLDLDQQKSELVQLKLLVLDLESEKLRASEESSSVTSLQSELSEMHELLLAADVRLIFTRTQYEAWVEELVQQVYSTDRLLTELHTKNVDVETVLNSCLAREAQCNEENARLLTSLDTLRSELDSAIAENRVLFHENNSLIAQSEEYKSRAETMADNYGEHKSQLALEVERMKQLLVGSEEEIDDLMMSREELEIKVVVLKAKLAEQHAQVISSEGYIDEQKMLQNQCNELRRKLSEQILKTEEFRNLSIHLKELKDKADAECLKLHEKRESEGLPTGMQESLRIAFIKEQCETKVQELKHHLSISKKHSEEMLWKLQDAIDEIENRKKSEAAHLKKNEELGVKILELEAELQSLISDKREKTKAYDLAKAELECSLMSLECCKEEKEKLEVSLHECNEEKSRLYSDLSLMKKLLYSSTFPCRKEGNDGLHKESCISNELTGRNVQKTTNADTKSHGRMSADDTGNGPTGDVDEYLEHENMTNGIDAQNVCLGLSDEGSYSCTLMKEHPEQDVLQSSCLNGSSSLALVNQENTKSNDTKDLAIINDQFRVQSLKSSMDLLNEELERMKNENSLSRGDHNFDPKFSSLQRELMELDKVNEELGNIYPLFNERPGSGNAIERVLALEIELAEALQAKKKSSMHFQSSFLKQHNDEEAIFQSFRDINELIKDMLEIKGRYATVETELRDMHDRYSQLSLQFAEVEGERQKLMMTLKNVRASKRGIPLFLSSSASLGDSKSPVTNSQ
ncbi:early endosome antigen 1 [Citrus clementina]|uniref:early endosome antigen 1 n=1 Tax=Citrus clementina TaxID=85681 RepID=UPI000CECF767|nr:early endosome antigen 1 [Citrus x clementina]